MIGLAGWLAAILFPVRCILTLREDDPAAIRKALLVPFAVWHLPGTLVKQKMILIKA
jgi:hypothetical protein